MGFEPHQPPSRIEVVNEFTDWMKDTLEEAKSALAKAKDDMARYYNRCGSPRDPHTVLLSWRHGLP